jgi:IS1 family transposase
VQVDEIWQFVYAKAENVPASKRETFGYGDVWTWVALDADSKMVLSWRVGPRDAATAYDLMTDLAERVISWLPMTTDGYRAYADAIEARSAWRSTTPRRTRCPGRSRARRRATAPRRSRAASRR